MLFTFGNASGISREEGVIVIKPSGVPYESMKPEDLVIVDMNGKQIEGGLRPSSDLPTHLILYKSFPLIGGIVHTHSRSATSWAQAQREIPCFGTTHADYFHGSVPVTKPLTPSEIKKDYELNTGLAIVRCIGKRNPLHTPGVLVAGHAPFCWGKTAADAAHNVVLSKKSPQWLFKRLPPTPKRAQFQSAHKSTSSGNTEKPLITGRNDAISFTCRWTSHCGHSRSSPDSRLRSTHCCRDDQLNQ